MSDWSERERVYKDFRRSKDGPEAPRGHRATSADKKRSKRSRRWCNGKSGVEHSVVLADNNRAQCSACGMSEYNLPVEALAQVYERADNYVRYNELCKEFGHTWIVVKWWVFENVKYCEVCNYSPRLYSWAPVSEQ